MTHRPLDWVLCGERGEPVAVSSQVLAHGASDAERGVGQCEEGAASAGKPLVGVVGSVVEAGQRIGLMKFGSRMDVILGPEWEVMVKAGQRVSGGSGILARFKGAA